MHFSLLEQLFFSFYGMQVWYQILISDTDFLWFKKISEKLERRLRMKKGLKEWNFFIKGFLGA